MERLMYPSGKKILSRVAKLGGRLDEASVYHIQEDQ